MKEYQSFTVIYFIKIMQTQPKRFTEDDSTTYTNYPQTETRLELYWQRLALMEQRLLSILRTLRPVIHRSACQRPRLWAPSVGITTPYHSSPTLLKCPGSNKTAPSTNIDKGNKLYFLKKLQDCYRREGNKRNQLQ